MQEAVQEALANLRLEVTHKGDEESVLDDLATIECAITQRAAPARAGRLYCACRCFLSEFRAIA